jgi:cyclopropane fatty-acyl-phospholipid synthase-like methyltransferase
MTTLELGCGLHPLAGVDVVHHDLRQHSVWIDVAHNLNTLPWPWYDEQFEKIVALDVMEHLVVDVPEWLNECWRILQPGGVLALRLPAWNHENSFIDPTHRKLFHEATFKYWQPGNYYYEHYGCYYFAEAARWWECELAERCDAGANIRYVLRKLTL